MTLQSRLFWAIVVLIRGCSDDRPKHRMERAANATEAHALNTFEDAGSD